LVEENGIEIGAVWLEILETGWDGVEEKVV
jgi:hypothetical protein